MDIQVVGRVPQEQDSTAAVAACAGAGQVPRAGASVKITLHERTRARWIALMKMPLPELMGKIFRAANAEPCVDFLNQIGYRVVHAGTPGGTKKSFISFWDDLIRHVLDFVRVGKSDRDSCRSGSTGPERPDYLFIVDSVCVFRGHDKDPGEQLEMARRELCETLKWNYGDAPYVFGYAAVAYAVRLYAVTHTRSNVDTVLLGTYQLETVEGRLQLLLAVLNMARLLESVAQLCPDSARGEYSKKLVDGGIRILLEPSCVVKCYPEVRFHEAKCQAEVVYKVLKTHGVPHVDRLARIDQRAKRLIFVPRGQETRPADLTELFQAIGNVLEALVKLHAASWMHRDIRWPNVMKVYDDENEWFLIDFMDAAPSPQASPCGQHLCRGEHAPVIFNDNVHTTAVDVWSVGRLIQTSGLAYAWYDRAKFLRQLMHHSPSQRPTAATALEHLRQLEKKYFKYLERQEAQDHNQKKKKPRLS